MSEQTGRFLARWAKRKAAARQALKADAKDATYGEQHEGTEEGDLPSSDRPTGEQITNPPAELPKIESLGAGSDFKPFMADGVPIDLKNQALRKLWASNPLYNHIDMLDDYCEDYTDAACAVPGVKTAYQIGKGFVKELAEANDPANGGHLAETTSADGDDSKPNGTVAEDSSPSYPDDHGGMVS